MFNFYKKLSVTKKIIAATIIVILLFLIAVSIVIQISAMVINQTVMENTQDELTELARQIAITMDASIEPASLTVPEKMQEIVDRNMANRTRNAEDDLLAEIRVHAPDATSSNGYRAVAANLPELKGQESDPEDIEAIQNNIIVVEPVNEDGERFLDITVPLHIDGQAIATVGIMMSMEPGFALAEEITTRTTNHLLMVSLAIVLFTAIVGLIISIRVAGGITRPLKAVTNRSLEIAENDLQYFSEAIEALSQGDLTHDLSFASTPIEITTYDETGQLSEAFNIMINQLDHVSKSFGQMTGNLRALIGNVGENATKLSEASLLLSSTAHLSGQATTQIASTMQQISLGIIQESESVSRTVLSVEQMNQAINHIAVGAQEQAAAISNATNMTSQLSDMIDEISSNAKTQANVSTTSVNLSNSSKSTVNETIQGMHRIQEKVNQTADKVQEMGEQSDHIGIIVGTIEEIASQTNLLALNAAIEAARAGENGKGFAVVADEVRKLAEKSADATQEITHLVKSIQNTVADTIQAMQDSADEVEKGVELVNESGKALSDIMAGVADFQESSDSITMIASKMTTLAKDVVATIDKASEVVDTNIQTTAAMAIDSHQVTNAIENIASVSEENSAATEEVTASSEEVSAQAEEVNQSAKTLSVMAMALQELVSQFNLSNEVEVLEEATPV